MSLIWYEVVQVVKPIISLARLKFHKFNYFAFNVLIAVKISRDFSSSRQYNSVRNYSI